MTTTGIDLKRRLIGTGITQADVAKHLGLTEPRLSRILGGRDPMPEGFEESFRRAMLEISEERQRLVAGAAA